MCSAIELHDIMVYERVCRDFLIPDWDAKYPVRLANHLADAFISQTTYSEDNIYKRRNCNWLKLKSSFTTVKQIIQEKIMIILLLAIQHRDKK